MLYWCLAGTGICTVLDIAGVFGLKQIKTQEVVEQINDTVLVIAQAFRELYDKGKGLIGAPKECTDESEAWKDGDRVLRYVRVRNLKFTTYLRFTTCENVKKINELNFY